MKFFVFFGVPSVTEPVLCKYCECGAGVVKVLCLCYSCGAWFCFRGERGFRFSNAARVMPLTRICSMKKRRDAMLVDDFVDVKMLMGQAT